MRRHHKHGIRDQTSDHDNESIDRHRKTKPPQHFPPPRPTFQPASAKKALVLTSRPIVLVIIFLHQLLVMWRLGRRYFVVEQSGKDEADACASCTAHVCKHRLKRRHCHSHDVAQDNDGGCDGGESCVPHAIAFRLCRGFSRWLQETGSGWRVICGVGTPPRPPFQYCVNGGSTWVNLERVGKHDENHDGGFANGRGE